jgi:hypothetical protein
MNRAGYLITALTAPSAHRLDLGAGRPSGYAHGCVQITWFGMTPGTNLGDQVADHIE